ncbi:MAG: VCBS repeat-containing protein [Flavobacteriales bacterium]|nr:VCBS repeat-containing protein [Flavobacteriales bacterium]
MGARAQDDCINALPVGIGSFVVTTINGTEVSTPLCATSGPIATSAEWYTYTPVLSHPLTITTDLVVNSGGDTRFHVYTGTCGNLTCVGGDDDGGVIGNGYLSYDTLQVTALTTYYIVFDNSWNGNGFTFQLVDSIANVGGGPAPTDGIQFTTVTIPINGTAAVVDMTNDFLDDVASVTSTTIRVSEQTAGGTWVNTDVVTPQANYTPSWSMCVGDLDDNGHNDFMYGSGSGVTFMIANATATAYTEISGPEYVFCQRTNMIDINADGHLDAFSCHDVAANVFYMNDGNGNLTFNQGGLGETCGNYGSIWVDFDGDQDQDLFVAKCGCDPVDILYRNNGDGTFTNIAGALGFADTQQSWSSAWGDFNNDGHMDVLVGSSSGATHKVMRNNGDGTFTNVTPGSGFDSFFGTNIEWTTHDFDNDGYLDILGAGMMIMGHGDMTFAVTDVIPGNGPIGDLNNDGFLDILNGGTAYMNDGNDNNWLKVHCTGTVSNLNGIGARVQITSTMGTQIREIRSGDGFRYMSTLNAHFGIGADADVQSVMVYWPSGIVDVIENPAINTTLEVIESIPTAIDVAESDAFTLYPNPATDGIIIGGLPLGRHPARIMDVAGKLALRTTVGNGRVGLDALPSGSYLLEVEVDGLALRQRFTKQ